MAASPGVQDGTGFTTFTRYLPALLPVTTVINAGSREQQTGQMFLRFNTGVLNRNPRYVIIPGGRNDIFSA